MWSPYLQLHHNRECETIAAAQLQNSSVAACAERPHRRGAYVGGDEHRRYRRVLQSVPLHSFLTIDHATMQESEVLRYRRRVLPPRVVVILY